MNVFVVARSAPGAEVRVVDLGDDVRLRDVEEVGVALDVAPVVAEPLAPVVGLRQPSPVDEHAPRAVVDGDPPIEDLSQLVGRAHVVSLGSLSRERTRPWVARGSLGVW